MGEGKRFTPHATAYKGVYYIEGTSPSTGKPERIYYISYYRNGKRHFEKAGRAGIDKMTPLRASKLRGAKMEGRELPNVERRAAGEAARRVAEGKWTLSRLFEEYTAQHPGKKLANEKSRFKNYLAPAFGDKTPEEIDALAVDRLRVNLLKKRQPATVFAILELFRRLVRFGVDRRLCGPLSFKMLMPKVDNLKTEDLNAEQMARLLKVLRGERLDDDKPGEEPEEINSEARDIVYMALYTGMRRSEIFRLKWEDIDTARGFIAIRKPKGGKDATIPLSGPAREVLEGRPRTDSPYVFPGRYGGKRTDVKRALDKIRTRAKLPEGFRPLHGLRHVFASHLASSGQVDLFTLQKLLTHKTPMMTQRYAHLRDDTMRRAAEIAGRLIGDTLTGQDTKKAEGGNE